MTVRRRLAARSNGHDFGHIDALRPHGLESAVARQTAGFGETVMHKRAVDVAATMFFGLVLNHAFENGNKRTALVSMLVSLERNGLLLVSVTEEQLYEFATAVAAHRFETYPVGDRSADSEVKGIAAFLATHTRQKVKGDHNFKFPEFRKMLEEQGCVFDKPKNNFIKVIRITPIGRKSTRMGYPKRDFNVGVSDVKRVRRNLELDDEHGVDSGAFYDDLDAIVDNFVNTHRRALDLLAEA
jgi:prophage maintenance system killer protein